MTYRQLAAGVAAGLALVASTLPSGAMEKMFKLLRLESETARWHASEPGAVVKVTYGFADRPMTFESAHNCRGLQPVEAALAPSQITSSTFRAETRAAFQAWAQVVQIEFAEVRDADAADIVIGAQTDPIGRAFTNVELDRARPHLRPRAIAKSLICLNPEMPWKVGFDGDLDVYDLRYTMTHEIGHALGLDHPGASGQIMGYRYDERVSSLQTGDIDGILELYPPTTQTASIRNRATAGQQERAEGGQISKDGEASTFGLGARRSR